MSMRATKVSILSPVYNEARFVEEMISSVQAQSLSSWELLFVDDGSTDDTVAIIKSYLHDNRIRLISEGTKVGKNAAFNMAYSRSAGDIIVLLAGDDRLPRHSLEVRYGSLSDFDPTHPSVGFYKMRTFSDDPKFDGMILPRKGGSRSGGSITMNRELADALFPIDESLVSEDIWLGHGAVAIAANLVHSSEVVVDYRIHPGNSNPRALAFDDMSESIHARYRAFEALLACRRFTLSASTRAELTTLSHAEDLRYGGQLLSLLRTRLPVIERLALASAASPALFAIRTRFYKLFSGHRGR